MNKIKIGYFADGPWSHLAFEKIIQDPEIDVKFIAVQSPSELPAGFLEECVGHPLVTWMR